ncbi:hypothetical protein OSJ77_20055 [Phyllobacterium sp. 0TCS1.6C]|uniref:hypothetical protein n=2 Tax=unclassified Phyllobacterium TaxID=2638441 RepID=UPI0022654DB1|nr:hypothetical protein [Phyllobacterium sp. 0TCS1.6C]MCX8282489.1 hypothetical protein [Phyllobacterium sp. 0TCS1.6C]
MEALISQPSIQRKTMSENRVQIAPMAAVNEQRALIQHYENRNLLLANELQTLRDQNEQLQAQLKEAGERIAELSGEEPETIEESN